MSMVKEELRLLLQKLPDDCTLEDVQYHLYVLEKIQKSEERAKKEGTLTQAEVETRLHKWTTE